MEPDQKLVDDVVAAPVKLQDGEALLDETSMALQYGMHTPSEVAEAARAACDEVLKLSNIDDNVSRSVRPDRDMLLQRSKSKRHSKKRHKKDKKHKKEKRRSHRKGAQISGDYGARAEHKQSRHTISMGSAPQQVRHGMDVQQISLSTIYKHGVTRHTSEKKPTPGFTPRPPSDCVMDSIRRHKSQHQEVRRIRPRSSKKLAPIHHRPAASGAFDDSLEVSDSILAGAAAAPSSLVGADNSADEANLAISRSQSDMSTGFNFNLKRSSTDLNKIASALKQIDPLPPHLIARNANSAGPPSSPMMRLSPDRVPATRDWKKSRRARSPPPPMLARSGHSAVESAQQRFNLNVNLNYPVPIDRRHGHDRRHAFSNDTNAAKATTHFESKQDTSRKVENFSRTPSPTEDTENDVAGLFVRAPNGLCMDFDALSEEVSFIDNSTDFRAAAASADPGSAEELVGHFNSFPKQ